MGSHPPVVLPTIDVVPVGAMVVVLWFRIG